jgi:hypothetical protein
MNSFGIVYRSRADAEPEGELNALATAYRFILNCHERKKAASESRPDDGTKTKEDSASVSSLPH